MANDLISHGYLLLNETPIKTLDSGAQKRFLVGEILMYRESDKP